MKRAFRAWLCFAALFLFWSSQALAAGSSTYVVLPFSIQGPQGFAYLERSIPQMLTSRLYWKGHAEPAIPELPASQAAVVDESAAEKARGAYKADYVVWGSVSVVGETCSLDVRVRNKAGKVWTQSREAAPATLIGAIKSVSDSINREVFGRKAQAQTPPPSSNTGGAARMNQMNPDIMVNETSPGEVYLNPQFRYSGSAGEDSSRLRSQFLPYAAVGMEVVDTDGDGKNEILILTERTLYAYRFVPEKMTLLGQHSFSNAHRNLSIRSLPSRSGLARIVVNAVDSDDLPTATFLTFDGKNFQMELERVKFFFNVVKLPPDYIPTLIGQQPQPPRLFRPGIYEMIKQGGTYTMGKRLAMPDDMLPNVLNFAWLPPNRREKDSEKLIILNSSERLVTFAAKGARLAESPEKYSGSAVGMEVDPTMPGLGEEQITQRNLFYIPMRMLPVDLDHNGNYELIVNRPISTASDIFDRYRMYPQSEIHSLFWDGMGLNLQWKTRRIKGSMVDYAIADANNDGIPDLVTCVNSHPGALGAAARKAMVVLYPLDLSRTDPNTPVRSED